MSGAAGLTTAPASEGVDEPRGSVGEVVCQPVSGFDLDRPGGLDVLDGEEQPLGDFPRHESRWGTVDHLATAYRLEGDGRSWSVDADGWARTVT